MARIKESFVLLAIGGVLFGISAIFCVPVKQIKKSPNLFHSKSDTFDIKIRSRVTKDRTVPNVRYPGIFSKNHDRTKIIRDIKSWRPEDETNIWELSGLLEGDIMIDPRDLHKHGIRNESLRWRYGIVPYLIQEDDFTEEELQVIEGALDELRESTCLRFRPKKESDVDYVLVQSSEVGCWSFVGRRGEGQVLNLMTPACVKHGVVVHEFVHALGFYHQQSSYDRDKYVTIHWDNIREEHKHNFKKYDFDKVSNYHVGYDYNSLMHYGRKAFALDKTLPTITPKDETATIGQRFGLSDKDIAKLKAMYLEECKNRAFIEGIIDTSISFNF